MSIHRPTVLILTSDPAFAREVTTNWPRDPASHSAWHPDVPEFVVLDDAFSRDLGSDAQHSNHDLAIADASSSETNIQIGQKEKQSREREKLDQRTEQHLKSLVAAGKPAIIVRSDYGSDFYHLHGAVIELRRDPGIWAALTGLLGREILRRRHAESRARDAEAICATAQAEATLGRYMLEMRTNVNNALTTVLGNAELLALEPGLPATVLAQSDSIRNMALRLHEIFQRFSSLEKELTVAARESGKRAAQAAARS